MNSTSKNTKNLHALLIGIDCYLPNRLPGGYYYSNLGGCVRDINHVEEFLLRKLGMPHESILKLTATNTGKHQPKEPRAQWPTYENMVSKLKELISKAKPGEQVYIHYSGHGGRTNTIYPELKGKKGLDEALVPTDIGNSETRYFRDVEIAHILKTMVDKGLIVTVVLDSCHSGGATRGFSDAVVRCATPFPGDSEISMDFIDSTIRPTDSLVAPTDELISSWSKIEEGTSRALKPASGWLLEPQGYTLLAACRASESASEYPFNGLESNGALTYWMLDSLKQIGPGLTYKSLHDRILVKVHSQFPQQTPQLQGEGNRLVFGSEQVQPFYTIKIMQVDLASDRILLEAGQAHGFRKGAQFAIYTPDADLSLKEQRIALAEVEELGATESWAKITGKLRRDEIVPGAQAVLLDSGNIRLQRTVNLLINNIEANIQIEKAINQSGSGFIRLSNNKQPADFQITVNDQENYEIRDSAGMAIINLRPDISVTEMNSDKHLVNRLVHLAKYRNVQELDNRDNMSPLANKLIVELAGVQSDFDPVDAPNPTPFNNPGNTPMINIGEWTFLRVRNNLTPGEMKDSSRILNITVLNLKPDWGIKQIYPSGAGLFEPLDPGQEILLPLHASLPNGYEKGTDVVKVFGTIGTTNFRWLELPPLDSPPTEGMRTRSMTKDPLEMLLTSVTSQEPKTRTLDLASYPSREWITAQLEVRIQKNMT